MANLSPSVRFFLLSAIVPMVPALLAGCMVTAIAPGQLAEEPSDSTGDGTGDAGEPLDAGTAQDVPRAFALEASTDDPSVVDALPAEDSSQWLAYVNGLRAASGAPPLSEDPALSAASAKHAAYIVKTGTFVHEEDRKNPHFTKDGNEAGTNGLLSAANEIHVRQDAIRGWAATPFHGVALFDPRVSKVGFGDFMDAVPTAIPSKTFVWAATLDINRGRKPGREVLSAYPIRSPGAGAHVDLTKLGAEVPNPLTSCPGYVAPNGFPILLELGIGNVARAITTHSFKSGGKELAHCVFDQTTYVNPDRGSQVSARATLERREALVLIPKEPLKPGATYQVTLGSGKVVHSWEFSVASVVRD